MMEPHPIAPALPVHAAGEPRVRAYHSVQESDRAALEAALRESNGNKSRAAQTLNMTLRQFNYRLKILGISSGRGKAGLGETGEAG